MVVYRVWCMMLYHAPPVVNGLTIAECNRTSASDLRVLGIGLSPDFSSVAEGGSGGMTTTLRLPLDLVLLSHTVVTKLGAKGSKRD